VEKKRKQTIKDTKNLEFISSAMKTNQRKAGKSLPDMYIQCKYKCLINKHPVIIQHIRFNQVSE